jgi:hypothetical protein
MILLDRTGSMCQDPDDNFQYPSCPDLAKARAGIEALLRHLDPRVASVALAVTPPAVGDIFNASGSNPGACDTSSLTTTAPFTTPSWRPLWYGATTIGWGSPLPLFFSEYYSGPIGPFDYHYYDTSGKYLAYRSDGEESYVVAGFANDYLVNGSINGGSSLVSTLRCIQASGSTAYATALQRANSYLQTNGRADARKVLIFMSDGGANSASRSDYPNQNDLSQAPTSGPWSPNILHPCGQGVAAADTIRRLYPNTTIFAVGYAVAGTDTPGKGLQCYQAPHGSVPFATYTGSGPGPQPEQDPSWTARSALMAIADDQKHYLEPLHDPPTEADLTDLFTQIAQTIAQAKLNG